MRAQKGISWCLSLTPGPVLCDLVSAVCSAWNGLTPTPLGVIGRHCLWKIKEERVRVGRESRQTMMQVWHLRYEKWRKDGTERASDWGVVLASLRGNSRAKSASKRSSVMGRNGQAWVPLPLLSLAELPGKIRSLTGRLRGYRRCWDHCWWHFSCTPLPLYPPPLLPLPPAPIPPPAILFHRRVLDFVQCLFCIHWDNHVLFALYSIEMVYHIHWILDVKPTVCS